MLDEAFYKRLAKPMRDPEGEVYEFELDPRALRAFLTLYQIAERRSKAA